jgi:hypothetical protein
MRHLDPPYLPTPITYALLRSLVTLSSLGSLTKIPDRQGKGQNDEHESDDSQHPDDDLLTTCGSER